MARAIPTSLAGLLAILALLSMLPTAVADFTISYCSTQNTGADGQTWNWTWQSNGWCTGKCQASYAFAVIQGKDCWCSNYAPAEQEDMSVCDATCPGYRTEICGSNQGGHFVYLPMEGRTPSGTKGTSQPTSSQPPSAPPSPVSSPEDHRDPETVIQTVTAPAPVVSSASSSAAPTTLQTSTSPEPVTSQRVITRSDQVIVTETLIITPSSPPSTTSAPSLTEHEKSKSNVGAIAGGVVGGVVGLGAIIGGVWFFLWRRRRQQREMDEDGQSGIARNTSTMSKAGLIRTEKSPQYPPRIATSFGNSNNRRNSRMMQDTDSISPVSGSDRRSSRPYIFDQRLNPSAIMTMDNTSRGSFATLDDSRDYGRTLNVRNPDPEPRN